MFTNAGEYMESLTTFQQSLINRHRETMVETNKKLKEDGNSSRNFQTFKAGDLILVENQTRLKSDLTSPRFLGPYEVRAQIQSQVRYEDHSTDARRPLVKERHISECRPYIGRNSISEEIAVARAKSNTFVVESIQSHRFNRITQAGKRMGEPEFLVKWKG